MEGLFLAANMLNEACMQLKNFSDVNPFRLIQEFESENSNFQSTLMICFTFCFYFRKSSGLDFTSSESENELEKQLTPCRTPEQRPPEPLSSCSPIKRV